MELSCFAIPILFLLFIGFNPAQCRRYDIETEAMKLFGEDLKVVLKRFRRTPEYLTILNDKVVELKRNFDDMLKQVSSAYKVKMEKYIEKSKDKEDNKEEHNSRYHGRYRFGRRQGAEEDQVHAEANTLSPVEQLDRMVLGGNQLTAAESNQYRDVGFKYAGDAIHIMIQNMGPDHDAAGQQSTRSPDDIAPTTTEHVKVHEVSTRGPEAHTSIEEIITLEPTTTVNTEPEEAGPISETQSKAPKYVRHAYKSSNRDSRDKGPREKGPRHKDTWPGDMTRFKTYKDVESRNKGVRIKGPHDNRPYVRELEDPESKKRDAVINPYL